MGRVYTPDRHYCHPERDLRFAEEGAVWECEECGAWWRHDLEGNWKLGPIGRWRVRRKIRRGSRSARRGQVVLRRLWRLWRLRKVQREIEVAEAIMRMVEGRS